ncbi:hypothetical protein SCHPADRAFT_945083 [Schizopora paradoxa]|uniref:Uncharacterized protein n=1 Tax=Schizopora paradoxa TaxID=27342 RepID=A0A0H2RDQ5_9AGAM|nr:hypothetical protein SCHPADRAFT_945083 [Schizopora paradoxa]
MDSYAAESATAFDAGVNTLPKNMKPCIACSKARKKCELVEGTYPCKRCTDRFLRDTSKGINCIPSKRRSGLQNGGVPSALNGGQASMEDQSAMQWIPYYGPQDISANDTVAVAPQVPLPHVTPGTNEAQSHALDDHDMPPVIADPEAFGQGFSAGSSWFFLDANN